MELARKEKIKAFFAAAQPAMLRDLVELISIPSVRSEPQADMPYGLGPCVALQKAMELMEQQGLNVKNYDNYVCTGDLSDLPAGLDVLAHLDVVPAENNWTVCQPYQPVLMGGRLYGRGAIDDKGPAIAALYAMACVKKLGIPLKKNIRLILGTDEECGSSDIEHYYAKEPEAPMTFTPDASFPLINMEKGRLCGELGKELRRDDRLPCVVSAESGLKSNVIPETAKAVVAGLTLEQLQPYLDAAAERTGAAFAAEQTGNAVTISCKGKSGHAAYPESANNALTAMLNLLAALPCADAEGFQTICSLSRLFPHGDYRGEALGIAMEDAISGSLTCSADLMRFDEVGVYLCFDSRCPACATDENTRKTAARSIAAAGLTMQETNMVLPHYVDADSDFVRTLLQAYRDWTGFGAQAESTGGGTYVHDLKNGVAFGCEMQGIDNHLHGADEFITLDQLTLSAEIFTEAMIALCC